MTGPLPIVPGTMKLRLQFTSGNDTSVWSHLFWGGFVGGPPPPTDVNSFVNQIQASWSINLTPLMSNTVYLTGVTATWLGDYTSPVSTWSGSTRGGRTGGPNAASVCTIINQKIGRRYRGGHPRLYLPLGVSTDLADPQHWAGAFTTQTQTAINTFINGLMSGQPTSFGTANPVSVSYWHAKALRPTPVVDPVTAHVVNTIPGTQRRRLRPG